MGSMFAPGLITGSLVGKLGVLTMMYLGITLQAVCAVICWVWQDLASFYGGLSLMGIGWNFAFVSGTVLLLKSHTLEERAQVSSANETLRFLANAVGVLLSSALAW